MSSVRASAVLRRVACIGGVLGIASFAAACGGSLPRPAAAQVATSDYVAVPFSPRAPPVEFIPPSPAKGAVWVDGSWAWVGSRYAWRFGSWVIPPPDARRARWVVVRRRDDGQLFFAPSSWKDAAGKTIENAAFDGALGPAARARSRLGAPPPTGERDRGRDRTVEETAVDVGDSDD